jgi:uncharacterized protein (DUF927 family)
MKIHILYRHYNVEGAGNKSRPSWFDYKKCFINLLNTIEDKNVDLHVIMDGDSTGNFIENYKDKYTLHNINAGGDYNSYLETYRYIKMLNIDNNDLIYFLENDYLHIDNWVEEIVTLFQTYPQGLNYVSLYDHNDKYFLPMYDNLVSKIFTTETRHWRTTPSTCGSYIIPKNIFIEDEDINTGGPGDHDKFLHLNSTKNRFVLTPIPGLSTHCMEGLLSPTIDWKQINNK